MDDELPPCVDEAKMTILAAIKMAPQYAGSLLIGALVAYIRSAPNPEKTLFQVLQRIASSSGVAVMVDTTSADDDDEDDTVH